MKKRGAVSRPDVSSPNLIPRKGNLLVITRHNLEKIQEAGKDFLWQRPRRCPWCGSSRLWGHGFVLRYFFGYACGLWMKRWRCPDCGAVHTARPHEYAPGVQHPMKLQQQIIWQKLVGRPFLPEVSRQVQQHWKKVFTEMCRSRENWISAGAVKTMVRRIGQTGITQRRVYRKRFPSPGPPYLPFAVTVCAGGCSLA